MHVYLNSQILNFITFYVLSSWAIESCSCQGQFINVWVIQTDQVTSLTEVLQVTSLTEVLKSRSDGVGSFSQSRTNVHFLASLSLSLKFKHLFTGIDLKCWKLYTDEFKGFLKHKNCFLKYLTLVD